MNQDKSTGLSTVPWTREKQERPECGFLPLGCYQAQADGKESHLGGTHRGSCLSPRGQSQRVVPVGRRSFLKRYMTMSTEKNEWMFMETVPFTGDPVKAEPGSSSHRGKGPSDTGTPCSEGFLFWFSASWNSWQFFPHHHLILGSANEIGHQCYRVGRTQPSSLQSLCEGQRIRVMLKRAQSKMFLKLREAKRNSGRDTSMGRGCPFRPRHTKKGLHVGVCAWVHSEKWNQSGWGQDT